MPNQATLVRKAAEYAVQLRYEDIPAEAVQLAKWIVFDTIGTALGGYQRPLGQKAARFGSLQMAGDEATLLADGSRVTMEGAAFSNGVMGKILGMDDSHRSAGHIASQVIPAVLAVSEYYGTSGKDLICAIVASYDFAVRVGYQVRTTHRERGFDLKGTVGAMTAAMAVARCAGADVDTMANAISLAADMSSGTEQYVYEGGKCDTKDVIAGMGAKNGIFALRLAQAGFFGPAGALDGEYGFFRAFGDGFDPAIFDDLGHDFAIVSTAFKPHGGCRHTHQAIDAVQELLKQGPLNSKEIAEVTVATYGYATRPSFRVDPNPPSRDVAGLSIRVGTSVALFKGSAWPNDFSHWDDDEVRRLRNLIDVQEDSEIEANYPNLNGCRLTVKLANGETRQAYLPNMKGEPEYRMTEAEMIQKFRVLSEALFPTERVDEIFALCSTLDTLDEISAIIDLTRTEYAVEAAQPVG